MTVRVAVVSPNFVGGHFGGVETVASWLRDVIDAECGFTAEVISVATARNDPDSQRLTVPSTWARAPSSSWHDVDGVPVEHFGSWVAELEPARYLPRRSLSGRLRTFDIVQVVCGTPAFGLAATNSGRPVCLQVATTAASERRFDAAAGRSASTRIGAAARSASTAVVGRLERRALRRADHTFVENQWMLEQVQAVVGGAVTLAPPGVDDRSFVPRASDAGEGYLLTVGRLSSERKNLDGLLRSYAFARSEFDLDLPLVMVGGGTLPPMLRSLIDELGLSGHVRVVEGPPQEELVSLYQGARLFVSASHEEGLGLVYLEAQSCGIPVVSTSNAGADEIFRRGAVGRVVEPFKGSSGPLASAMREWAARGAGQDQRAAARDFVVTQFGTEVSAGRFIDRYRKLLA